MLDVEEVKPGLVLFRRADVKHRNFYCRIRLPTEDRYKTVSLKTSERIEARAKALEADADVRFRLKHGVPVFNKTFAQVAAEYVAHQKQRAEAGQISKHRAVVVDTHVRRHLCRYVGSTQITLIGQDRWDNYPIWRRTTSKGLGGRDVSAGTIRDEMASYRGIMGWAAARKLIPESHVPKGKLPKDPSSREEFTPDEYRALHTFARKWIKDARTPRNAWYRSMVYNFILVMTNTGMRPSEARNLRWRDVSSRTDKQGRRFAVLNVRGKGKSRSLVATTNVSDYLDRIRESAKATGPDDPVFSNFEGQVSVMLYADTVERLLIDSKLLLSVTGRRRSTYCFRHTYATFRLSEGVDSLMLAHQMGTSVQMIQKHYGHITPTKNAERILQGMQGWVPVGDAVDYNAEVNLSATAPAKSGRPVQGPQSD